MAGVSVHGMLYVKLWRMASLLQPLQTGCAAEQSRVDFNRTVHVLKPTYMYGWLMCTH
jgi:hypothetical protein